MAETSGQYKSKERATMDRCNKGTNHTRRKGNGTPAGVKEPQMQG